MKQGDFSELAEYYHNRPAYSPELVKYILKIAGYNNSVDFSIADIGAGTGKMTAVLQKVAPTAKVIAVEPNDEMRRHGQETLQDIKFIKGSAEATNLDNNSVNFACMASSFNWVDTQKALPEFKRILKDGGYFCAIWNPRIINNDPLLKSIEDEINLMLPELKKVREGKDWQSIITSTGDFKNCVFMSMPYQETMSKERYIGIWKSVNEIQAEAIRYGGGNCGMIS